MNDQLSGKLYSVSVDIGNTVDALSLIMDALWDERNTVADDATAATLKFRRVQLVGHILGHPSHHGESAWFPDFIANFSVVHLINDIYIFPVRLAASEDTQEVKRPHKEQRPGVGAKLLEVYTSHRYSLGDNGGLLHELI